MWQGLFVQTHLGGGAWSPVMGVTLLFLEQGRHIHSPRNLCPVVRQLQSGADRLILHLLFLNLS